MRFTKFYIERGRGGGDKMKVWKGGVKEAEAMLSNLKDKSYAMFRVS